jgi:hypothetical protein
MARTKTVIYILIALILCAAFISSGAALANATSSGSLSYYWDRSGQSWRQITSSSPGALTRAHLEVYAYGRHGRNQTVYYTIVDDPTPLPDGYTRNPIPNENNQTWYTNQNYYYRTTSQTSSSDTIFNPAGHFHTDADGVTYWVN